MTFYNSIPIIIILSLIAVFHILSALLDGRIATPVFKFFYVSIRLHIALLGVMLYESVSLSEVAMLFMGSFLFYASASLLTVKIAARREGRGESCDL